MTTAGRSGSGSSSAHRAVQVELDLRRWPLRDEPWRTWPWVGVVLLAGVVAGAAGGAVHLGLLASALVGATVWRGFVPVRYQLDPQAAIEVTFVRRRRTPWAAVRRYELRPEGVLLLPASDVSAMGRVHGRLIPWCGERERVIELVQRYAPHAERVEPKA